MRSLLALLAVLVGAWPLAARAQDFAGQSYINPFPDGDVYKLQAYGDAFADGMLVGLVDSFSGDTRIDVSRKARTIVGLMRNEFEDDMRAEEGARDSVHVAVVMVGINDRLPLRDAAGRRTPVGSAEWRTEYGRRVERLIRVLKRRNAAIYWVGLPTMARPEVNDDALVMNDIVRQKLYLAGAKYIDIQSQFADEAGNYSAYGPDLTGKSRLLREANGITFTPAGNRKLAHFLEQELKRDLLQARSERDIPLAGAEPEQKRVAALRPRPQPTDPSWKGSVSASRDDRGQSRLPDPSGEQRADNGRVTLRVPGPGGRSETVTLDLLRPAIPGAVVALLNRKDTGERPSQMGDVVADEISGGLVVLSSITPASQTGVPGLPRRISPTQTPYYAVLVKGDRLAPKPGRSDDFAWPRVGPEYGFVDPAAKVRPPPPPRPATRPGQRLGSRE
ncbi:MAG: DUF459 domain-containing protein [Hyphomicrobiaceae bacterium]|nr:DUF459 domain-containing protein [Hyphomicrobiaceae bacterium]